jgi:hypothetical protein
MLYVRMSEVNNITRNLATVSKVNEFCTKIKNLSSQPFKGVCMIKIKRAIDLLEPAYEYLARTRDQPPTTEEVQAIALKLNEAAQVMKERYPDEALLKMILECGPTLKAYLDHIDTNHFEKLKWNNNWIVTSINMCPKGNMLCNMRHLLDRLNIE